jgi:hypothetical protein
MLASGFRMVVGLKWQVCLLFAIVAVVPSSSICLLLPLLVTWLLVFMTHPMSSGSQQRVWVLSLLWWLGGQCDVVGVWA